MSNPLGWDDFFGLQRFGMTRNLDNIRLFCESLEHPENNYPSILVAGTNGKGTVVAILESILRCSSLKVGRYTSPHLLKFNERIQLCGELISDKDVFHFLEEHWKFIEEKHCTFFEVSTAMALDTFSRSGVEVAVVEVGLGGTWDATGVVNQILSVITKIDFDHTDRLGKTLPQIAADKAGIFRCDTPALIANQQPEILNVIEDRAQNLATELFFSSHLVDFTSLNVTPSGINTNCVVSWQDVTCNINGLYLPLTGNYQVENLRTAVAAANMLKQHFSQINSDTIAAGVRNVVWPGRMQKIMSNPTVILDVGHNPGSIREVVNSVRKIWKPDRVITIFSALKDKDIIGMLQILSENSDKVYMVPLNRPRGYGIEELHILTGKLNWNVAIIETVTAAISKALEQAVEEDLILIVGSHYLAEEVLKIEEYS